MPQAVAALRMHALTNLQSCPNPSIHAAAQQQQVDMVALEAEMRALAQQIQAQPDMTEAELQQASL